VSVIALLLVLAVGQAHPSAATLPDSAPRAMDQIGEAPISSSVKGVSAERTIAEFMNVCFRPRWNIDAMHQAIDTSEFGYKEQHDGNHPGSFRWESKRGILALEVGSPEFLQCTFSVGSNQPRTGSQLLAMLKPAVEAEIGHSVSEDDEHYTLEWTDSDSGYLERIELAGASNEPKQAIWFVFDKIAPGVREKLNAMIKQGTAGE